MKIWEVRAFKARIGEETSICVNGPAVDKPTFLIELDEYTKLADKYSEIVDKYSKALSTAKEALKREGIAVEGEG